MTSTTETTGSTAIVTGYTRTYVSGSSGLDTSALIEAAVEAKLQAAYTLEATVTENEAKIAAYQEMQGYLTSLMNALDILRNASGYDATASVFESRAAYLTASDGSDATDSLAVTVEDGVEAQSFTVEVQQLALSHKIGSDTQSSSDEALGLSGDFILGTVNGDSESISVTADMSLEDIADAINSAKGTTGVRASILQVSDDEYMLVLATTETGQTITLSDDGGIGEALGIVNAAGDFVTELQAAQNAIVEIDGVSVESSSNTIEDALSGLQLDLYVAEPGTTITVDVEADYSDVLEAIEAFVEAYNTYREFAIANQEVDSSGTVADDALLFGDSLLRNTNSYIYSALAELIETDDGGISLGSIGITFDENNYLVIDSDVLEEAIVEDSGAVAQLFEFQFTSSSDDLQVLRDDSALTSGSYTLDITVDGNGDVTSVSVDGDSTLFTVDGNSITGVDGGAFAGLKLVYTGESDSVTITISEGIGDLLYDKLDTIANTSSGALADAIAALEDTNNDLEAKVSDIAERAYDYEERLIDYYANLEAKIALAETMSDYIKAILSSDDD